MELSIQDKVSAYDSPFRNVISTMESLRALENWTSLSFVKLSNAAIFFLRIPWASKQPLGNKKQRLHV